jgi:hypothetical protein
MGLDMYLYAEKNLTDYDWYPEEIKKQYQQVLAITDSNNLQYKESKSLVIKFEAMYWRKANAIHKWFVDNVQDGEDECRLHSVGREHLLELVNICNTVIENPNQAEELLPVAEGFFFGSYKYDEWYFDYVKVTADELTRLLDSVKSHNDIFFTYQSSW